MTETQQPEEPTTRTYWGNRRTFEDIVRRQLAWVVTFTGIGAAALVTMTVLAVLTTGHVASEDKKSRDAACSQYDPGTADYWLCLGN